MGKFLLTEVYVPDSLATISIGGIFMGIPFRQKVEENPVQLVGRCKECGQEFSRRRAWQDFCLDSCRKEFHRRAGAWSLVEQEFILVKEAAERAGVSESTVRRWAREERVRSETHLGRMLIRRADLERKLRRQGAAHENRSTGQENASDSVFTGWPDLKNSPIN